MNTTLKIEQIEYTKFPLDKKGNFVKKLREFIEEHSLENVPPIIVYENNGHYSVIDGRKRLTALNILGYENIPAIVLNNNTESNILNLILNKRVSPNYIEETKSLKNLIKKGLSLKDISEKTGIPSKNLLKLFKLTRLCSTAEELLKAKKISITSALVLSSLEQEEQEKVIKTLLNSSKKITLKALSNKIKEIKAYNIINIFDEINTFLKTDSTNFTPKNPNYNHHNHTVHKSTVF